VKPEQGVVRGGPITGCDRLDNWVSIALLRCTYKIRMDPTDVNRSSS